MLGNPTTAVHTAVFVPQRLKDELIVEGNTAEVFVRHTANTTAPSGIAQDGLTVHCEAIPSWSCVETKTLWCCSPTRGILCLSNARPEPSTFRQPATPLVGALFMTRHITSRDNIVNTSE
jgi:hypothetical protein